MSLMENIQADLTQAMKDKDEKKVKALRMLSAAIKNAEIDKRPQELEEADVLSVIKREDKKLKDAIEEFRAGEREDLAQEYAEEVGFLKEYLPEEIPEEEIRKIVKEKIYASEDPSSPEASKGHSRNFGIIMKEAMAELKGKADGGLVSRIVREELGL